MKMRTFLIAAYGGLLMMSAGIAAADTVVVSPEDETIIREYVVKNPVDPIELPSDYQVVVGSELPDSVTLTRIESSDLKRHYEYVRYGDQILLIDPDTRRIVDILEKQ
ncbi:MAG: DUF1236 domain-containing protein [Rhizobiales bacterium]|nr:DUF1236 domain-containing protein [Hyphomicrobiales bacterium]